MWWLILIAVVLGKVFGKKLGEWANDEKVKKEWGELVKTIDDAYADNRISLEEIWQIGKEAKDVIDEITRERGDNGKE